MKLLFYKAVLSVLALTLLSPVKATSTKTICRNLMVKLLAASVDSYTNESYCKTKEKQVTLIRHLFRSCQKLQCDAFSNTRTCLVIFAHKKKFVLDKVCSKPSSAYAASSSTSALESPSSAPASATPSRSPGPQSPSSIPESSSPSKAPVYSSPSSALASPTVSTSVFSSESAATIYASISSSPSSSPEYIYTTSSPEASDSDSSYESVSPETSVSDEPQDHGAAAASPSPSMSPGIEYCLDYANTTCETSCGSGTAEVRGSLVCDVVDEKCCEPFEAEKCVDPYFKCGSAGSCNGKVATGYVGCNGATPECCEFEPCITDGGVCRTKCNADEEGTAEEYPCEVLGGICCFPKYEEEIAE